MKQNKKAIMLLARIEGTQNFAINSPAHNQNKNNHYIGDVTPVKLFGHPLSPYVRRVMSVLEFKQIPYVLDPTLPTKYLNILGKPVSEEFQAASREGKIPAIKVEGRPLSDSSVIINFLEQKFQDNSLSPEDLYTQAESQWFEKYADGTMGDVFYRLFAEKIAKKVVFDKAGDEEAIKGLLPRVPGILQYLENSLEDTKTRFLVSDTLGIGDVAVLHQFAGLKYAGVEIDLSQSPRLAEYLKVGLSHPAISGVLDKVNEMRKILENTSTAPL